MVVIVVTATRVDVVISSPVARRSSCLVTDNVFQILISIMVYVVGEIIENYNMPFPSAFHYIARAYLYIDMYLTNNTNIHV